MSYQLWMWSHCYMMLWHTSQEPYVYIKKKFIIIRNGWTGRGDPVVFPPHSPDFFFIFFLFDPFRFLSLGLYEWYETKGLFEPLATREELLARIVSVGDEIRLNPRLLRKATSQVAVGRVEHVILSLFLVFVFSIFFDFLYGCLNWFLHLFVF